MESLKEFLKLLKKIPIRDWETEKGWENTDTHLTYTNDEIKVELTFCDMLYSDFPNLCIRIRAKGEIIFYEKIIFNPFIFWSIKQRIFFKALMIRRPFSTVKGKRLLLEKEASKRIKKEEDSKMTVKLSNILNTIQ